MSNQCALPNPCSYTGINFNMYSHAQKSCSLLSEINNFVVKVTSPHVLGCHPVFPFMSYGIIVIADTTFHTSESSWRGKRTFDFDCTLTEFKMIKVTILHIMLLVINLYRT